MFWPEGHCYICVQLIQDALRMACCELIHRASVGWACKPFKSHVDACNISCIPLHTGHVCLQRVLTTWLTTPGPLDPFLSEEGKGFCIKQGLKYHTGLAAASTVHISSSRVTMLLRKVAAVALLTSAGQTVTCMLKLQHDNYSGQTDKHIMA